METSVWGVSIHLFRYCAPCIHLIAFEHSSSSSVNNLWFWFLSYLLVCNITTLICCLRTRLSPKSFAVQSPNDFAVFYTVANTFMHSPQQSVFLTYSSLGFVNDTFLTAARSSVSYEPIIPCDCINFYWLSVQTVIGIVRGHSFLWSKCDIIWLSIGFSFREMQTTDQFCCLIELFQLNYFIMPKLPNSMWQKN